MYAIEFVTSLSIISCFYFKCLYKRFTVVWYNRLTIFSLRWPFASLQLAKNKRMHDAMVFLIYSSNIIFLLSLYTYEICACVWMVIERSVYPYQIRHIYHIRHTDASVVNTSWKCCILSPRCIWPVHSDCNVTPRQISKLLRNFVLLLVNTYYFFLRLYSV